MNIRENEILRTALLALGNCLGVKDAVTIEGDGRIRILGEHFICDVRRTLDKTTYNLVVNALKMKAQSRNACPLLVCGRVSDEIISSAKADGIHILDVAGNCEITPEGGPFISIRGRKSEVRKQPATMAFRTAGLKVLYYLLLDRDNIRKPFRFIQAETGVSVATVKNVVDALTPQYCFESQGGRNLKDARGLLDFWAQQYNLLYKPRLLVASLDFVGARKKSWSKVHLPQGMHWGGECGANKLDGFLSPQTFELYTEIPLRELLKTGMVFPALEGEITVYEKFWKKPETGLHPIVLYADLMGIADGRCREEAQRILNNELSYLK